MGASNVVLAALNAMLPSLVYKVGVPFSQNTNQVPVPISVDVRKKGERPIGTLFPQPIEWACLTLHRGEERRGTRPVVSEVLQSPVVVAEEVESPRTCVVVPRGRAVSVVAVVSCRARSLNADERVRQARGRRATGSEDKGPVHACARAAGAEPARRLSAESVRSSTSRRAAEVVRAVVETAAYAPWHDRAV